MELTNNYPIGTFYNNVIWPGEFGEWNLVRFSTPGDGSCLFHAISNSFFKSYRTEMLNGKYITRKELVRRFRLELSQKLSEKIGNRHDSPTYYQLLNGSNMDEFSNHVPEYSCTHMKAELASTSPIGYGYLEYIGNAIEKDIYILDGSHKDIYRSDELKYSIKGNRNSIVIYYENGHYELIAIDNGDGTCITHFSHKHAFIKFLQKRIKQFIRE